MYRTIYHLMLVFIFFNIIGCSSSSSGTKGAKDSGSKYVAQVGLASTFDFGEVVRRTLDKFQFQVSRYDETNERLYLETQWKLRRLFDDEQAQGVVEAETRIILETRPRIRSGGEVKLSNVQFTAENKVRYANAADIWVNAPLSPMCREYLKQVADELKDKFTATMRVY